MTDGKGEVLVRPEICVQHDWYEILRNTNEKAWVSFSQEGEKTVYGELTAKRHNDEIEIIGSDGFQATHLKNNVLQVKYKNKVTCFYPASKTFKKIHKKGVRCLNISPLGGLGVSCSEDETLSIWQTEDGVIRRSLEGHVSDVTHCRFFPSGVVILSGGVDMRVKIWSAEDGSCPVTLVKHKGAITDTAIVDRGRNIISCSRDGCALLWDCGTASCLATLATPKEAKSASERVINACSLINYELSSETNVLDDRELGTSGKLLVLARNDGTIEGVNVQSRDQVFNWNSGSSINCCCFLSENRMVFGQDNGNILCMDIRNTSKPERTLRYGSSGINCIEPYFKNMILVGRGDGRCSCIHMDDLDLTKELIGSNLDPIYDISVTSNLIHTACRDGCIRQYGLNLT